MFAKNVKKMKTSTKHGFFQNTKFWTRKTLKTHQLKFFLCKTVTLDFRILSAHIRGLIKRKKYMILKYKVVFSIWKMMVALIFRLIKKPPGIAGICQRWVFHVRKNNVPLPGIEPRFQFWRANHYISNEDWKKKF